MWYSEVHRIGFRKCTPLGYALLIIGDYCFITALALGPMILLLLSTLKWREFQWTDLCWALGLIVAGLVSKVTANTLESRYQFRYDYKADEASWGTTERSRYTHADWEADRR